MNCPACAHPNRTGAKFCEECAAPLPRACASCGSDLRPNAKFCDECGTATGAPAPARRVEASDARKVVTIVFADLVGSTALHERLDPESARRFMEGYYAAMRGAVESHGGAVTQFLGDGVKAVFGIPRVAEDDAIRAVRAAVAMQAAFRAHADPQREAIGKTGLRVAVNTGEVVTNDASEIIGDPVNVAARLQEQGRDGDVVVGETTQRLVSALVTLELLGSFALKGRTEAVSAYRVTSLQRPVGAAAAAFVGRDEELARIRSVYDTSVEKPATGLAVLVGSPGLGKSRLIEEFARRLGESSTLIHAHCDAAGGATFAPLADALRALPDLNEGVPGSDAERARIVDGVRALLAGSPAPPEETFFVVRRLLAALASTKPVVLVIDDVHWAEPLLLDLIEHLVQWGSGVPLLVLVGARPELRDVRSTLVTPGGLVSDVVTLSGLDAGAAMRLAANVIGAADLPASVAAKVLATSEGNPLFVGELVRMLVHEGALKREGERWTAGTTLAALEMPPTIHALLAARIERLRAEERIVLERAAVIGRSFSRSAVAELLSRDVTDLDARLESLRRAELIERDSGWFLGEPVLRFHHVLIRDAAYRRILKGTRAELHARFADWVEVRAGDSLEHDETIGWHLEQAHQHLRELGPIDARGRALGERAAQRLAVAGRRALARDDVPLASGLLGRALDRLDRDDPARAELALDWCEALLAAGDVAPATAALEELARFAASDARLRAWHTCFVGQLKVLTAPSGLFEAAESVAAASRDLAELGDIAGEAKAHFVHAQAFARLGKVAACEAALDRALAAARRAGDRRRANTVLALAPLAALWGPSPVTRASGRCLDVVRVLRITQGAPAVEAVALSCQGVLEALRGRTDAARRMIASARKMVEELGITQRLLEADVFAARIDLLDGDAASAERGLRAAYEGMRERGLGIDAARAAALLARALLALDRAAEAEVVTRESEQLAGDDLQAAIAWRGARAEALARRGETVEAVALASKAVEIAAATDALLDHADARLALAAALRAAGRNVEADTEEGRATELWVAKGATLLAERARRASTQAATAPVQPEARLEPARSARLRIRANRASRGGPRFEAAAAARDIAALEHLFADPCVVVHHPTGVTYGRREQLKTWQSLFRAELLTYRREPLATLGDSLELARHRISTAGFVEERLKSAGALEIDEVVICEDDGHGRHWRFEIFADDQLGRAIARLYERHAELLPDGPERVRAQAIARSAGVMLGQPDLAATATVLAPDVEFSDLRTVGFGTLRGAEAVLQTIAAMMDLSHDDSARIDDVLVLESDALVIRWTNRGTHVESGGAFERKLCQLFAFDAAGRLSRWQQFEAEHDGAALARFDALARSLTPKPPVHRRVRANLAAETLARMDAGCATRDVDAVRALHREDFEEVHHPTGSTYGLDGAYASLDSLLRLPNPQMVHELLATLGERHALARRTTGASSGGRGRIDVGAWEREELVVAEVDEQGRFRGYDTFGSERLADAVARLYKRRADSPGGTAGSRAAATAQSLAALLAPPDIDRIAASVASSVETNDHKVLGYGRARGADNVLRAIRIQIETAEAIAPRVDDVLALEPSALLVRRTVSGVLRDGGGPYEKLMISLYACGDDGLVEHWEQFDPDREAEALARFDALVSGNASEPPVRRHVKANLATAALARFDAGCAARDVDAIKTISREDFEEVHRPTGSMYGLEAAYASLDNLFRLPDSRLVHEPLATLGAALVLSHRTTGASAGGRGRVDSAAWDREEFVVAEVDEQGRLRCFDTFAGNQLGDALARLYERHAEILPDGPERTRAATTARAVYAMVTESQGQGFAASVTSTFEAVDHRLVGHDSVGAEELARGFAAWRELTDHVRIRVDAVLALSADGLLRRSTSAGVVRASGGAFERTVVMLTIFGPDGLIARTELFDVAQEAQAFARFDALIGGAAAEPEPPFANAAWRCFQTYRRAWIARDWKTVENTFSPALRMDDRRRMVRLQIGGADYLTQLRMLFDQPGGRWEMSLIATRGDRLALSRGLFHAEVAGGGGPLEFAESLSVSEIGVDGRVVALVVFDPEEWDAAYAELDARFAAGEGAAHPLTLAALRDMRRAHDAHDWDAYHVIFSPDLVCHDHRVLGWGTLHGVDVFVRMRQTLFELAPDARWRNDHIRLGKRGHLQASLLFGTRDGGAFERELLRVSEIDVRGRISRIDIYDTDRFDEAFARFDALIEGGGVEPSREHFENAASRADTELFRCFNASDWDGVLACVAGELVFDERRRLLRNTCGRDVWLEQFRLMFDLPARRFTSELVATRGERLSLNLHLFEGEVAGGGGPFEMDGHYALHEVDDQGRIVAIVLFDEHELDAANAELDARFDAGEGAAHAGALAAWRRFEHHIAIRDWPAQRAAKSRGFVFRDHRLLGWGTAARETADKILKTLVDLAPDVRRRHDHVRLCERGILEHLTQVGTRDGGAFEIVFLAVYEWDAQGRLQAIDNYDVDRFEQAQARFDELKAATPPPQPFANAASRFVEHGVRRLWEARDWDGIVARISPAMRMDDRRRIVRLEIGYDEFLAQFRMLLDQPGSRWQEALLATRGERLSLHRTRFEAEVAGGGPLAFDDHLSVTELDADGRWVASVTFDLDDLDAAYAELDRRYESGEDEAHAVHSTVMRTFARAIETRDWNPVLALCAPTLVEHDHRPLAVLGTTHGADAWVRNFRVLGELAPDSRYRVDHFRSSARGFCTVGVWVGTREGGPYEIPLVAVLELDAYKRIARADVYDADQLEQARARFEALSAAAQSPPRFENAATRNVERATLAQGARDLDGFAACFASEFRNIDRRPLVQLDLDREQFLAGYRQIIEMTSSRPTGEVLATRGDRLALVRIGWRGAEGDVGPSEIDWLLVIEVNDRGETVASVAYDSHDLDAAYAELDARFENGEAAAHPNAARVLASSRFVRDRDWRATAAGNAPGFEYRDHRLLGWGSSASDTETFIRVLKTTQDLSPDARYRHEHVRISAHGVLRQTMLSGTRDGGAFENPMFVVARVDEQGRIESYDSYDLDDFDRARARFAELGVPPVPAPGRFENVAARALREVIEVWGRRDAERYARLHASELRYRDHRRMFQLDLDRDQYLEFSRPLLQMAAGMSVELLATRGERLALFRQTMEMSGDEVGPSAIDSLLVAETAESGAIVALERFDVDDLEAAQAELRARFDRGEAAVHPFAAAWLGGYLRCFAARDWAGLRALFAPDLVGHNHRLVGWGTLSGPEALVSTLEAQVALAPDTRERVDHVRTCERGVLFEYAWLGSHEGGEFENVWIVAAELDARGRATRVDVCEQEQLSLALARFEEVRLKADTASVAMERWNAAFEIAVATDDWGPMRALCTPDFRFDDRRRLALVSGGLELMIASARERVAIGARPQMVAIENAGDRVAIARTLWSGGPEGGRFEIEYLAVVELDASGLLSAFIFIDADDVRKARREAWARWAAIEPNTAPVTTALGEMVDLFNEGRALGAPFADDLVVDDHRRTGTGRLDGLAAYAESIAALRDLAPDSKIEAGWRWLAVEPYGAITVMRRTGTLREGGDYDAEHLVLLTIARGRVTRLELFELEDADAALARFAELRPDPSRIPPNAATRANDRGVAAIAAGDREALRALASADFGFEDRGKRALVVGDVEVWLDSALFLGTEHAARLEPELLATNGDRIAVYRDVWSGASGGAGFELEKIRVFEVDDEGQLRALLNFDAEDRPEAFAEAIAHFASGEAAGCVAVRVLSEFLRAINARDWEALRETYTADFALTDRRPLGLGALDRDAWIASLQASVELSVGLAFEVVHVLAWNEHGVVVKLRRHGSMPDGGGPFENFPIGVALNRGNRISRYELFEDSEAERALARFEELCAAAEP